VTSTAAETEDPATMMPIGIFASLVRLCVCVCLCVYVCLGLLVYVYLYVYVCVCVYWHLR